MVLQPWWKSVGCLLCRFSDSGELSRKILQRKPFKLQYLLVQTCFGPFLNLTTHLEKSMEELPLSRHGLVLVTNPFISSTMEASP